MDEEDLEDMIDYERQMREQTAARNKAILNQVDKRVEQLLPVGKLSLRGLKETGLRLFYTAAVLRDRRRIRERA